MKIVYQPDGNDAEKLKATYEKIRAKQLSDPASVQRLLQKAADAAPKKEEPKAVSAKKSWNIKSRILGIGWNGAWKIAVILLLVFIAVTLWNLANPETQHYR